MIGVDNAVFLVARPIAVDVLADHHPERDNLKGITFSFKADQFIQEGEPGVEGVFISRGEYPFFNMVRQGRAYLAPLLKYLYVVVHKTMTKDGFHRNIMIPALFSDMSLLSGSAFVG